MIEELATSIVVWGSALLFVYWFRYVCLLILSAKTARDYGPAVAAVNRLRFPEVQAVLRDRTSVDPIGLQKALDRDYAVLTYLLKHSAAGAEYGVSVETRILGIHYRIMRAWCSVSWRFSPSAACRALDRMAIVVAYFANTAGERVVGHGAFRF